MPTPAPLNGSGPLTARRPGPWAGFFARLVVLAAGAALFVWIPFPLLDDWLPSRHVAAAVLSVLATGKLLYDTLFYTR